MLGLLFFMIIGIVVVLSSASINIENDTYRENARKLNQTTYIDRNGVQRSTKTGNYAMRTTSRDRTKYQVVDYGTGEVLFERDTEYGYQVKSIKEAEELCARENKAYLECAILNNKPRYIQVRVHKDSSYVTGYIIQHDEYDLYTRMLVRENIYHTW